LAIHAGKAGAGRPIVLTEHGKVRRQAIEANGPAVELAGHIKLKGGAAAKTPAERAALVAQMVEAAKTPGDADGAPEPDTAAVGGASRRQHDQIAALRSELRAHPAHACPDREAHARWARRLAQARAQRDSLERSALRRTGSLARQFDQIQAVLKALGYLKDGQVTPAGRILSRVYAERDLTIAECVRTGAWDGLEPEALAAAVTALVYEPRGEASGGAEPLDAMVRRAIGLQVEAWRRIRDQEEALGVPPSPGVEPGASAAVWRWARGEALAAALDGGRLSPGDFVRLVSRVVDVLDHIRTVAPNSHLYHHADLAITRLRRGVVALDQS
jgi:ATP-dependent RNA helicase HelY